jgi:uncharacterized damage-inducible protein DinB
MIAAQLIDAWNIHNRVNLYLLDAISPEALEAALPPRGRRVGDIFSHLHAIRLVWLETATPDRCAGLAKIDKSQATDKALLRQALESSGAAIAALLQRGFEAGKIKGFKPHPAAFFGYLIAHESHHRGEVGVLLKESGYPLDRAVDYRLWEWGKR